MDILNILIDKIERKQPELTDDYKEQVERLVNSIKEQGLFHPLTVRPANEQGMYVLASGSKRLDALIQIGERQVPCVIRAVEEGEPDEITHIHENLMRFNLPWYEVVEMERQLHALRIAEKGQGKPGKKSGWSLRDTAKELDMSFGVLSEDIRIAEIIEADPSLRKIGDKKTARRVIFTMLKQLDQEASAQLEVPDELSTDRVYSGSSEIVLQGFPMNTFHACITDPPWTRFKDAKYTKDEFTLKVFEEIFRVLKPNSFLYAFVSTEDFFVYLNELPKLHFQVQTMPNIWVKEGYMTRGKRTWEYERDYECILVAAKGSPALTSSMLSSIISCKIVPPQKMIHPNEKPKEVIRKIINDCSYEGALILDPFAGSGVVGEAAQEMKRHFVLIERDKEHCAKIRKRLGL